MDTSDTAEEHRFRAAFRHTLFDEVVNVREDTKRLLDR